METMQNLFQAAITQKIGWTLVHFVWQACAIGLLLAVLLKLLHKSSAHLRYLIACGGLALMVCAPVITLQMIPMPQNHTAPAVQPPADITDSGFVTPVIADMPDIEVPPLPIPPAATPTLPWQDRFTHTLEAALPYIVAGWLAGVLGLSLWYLGGWTQLQKFRRRMIQPVSPDLKAKLHQLAGRLGIRQSIDLFESALVQVPAVVGHLKPVILLPASALTGLSPQQLSRPSSPTNWPTSAATTTWSISCKPPSKSSASTTQPSGGSPAASASNANTAATTWPSVSAETASSTPRPSPPWPKSVPPTPPSPSPSPARPSSTASAASSARTAPPNENQAGCLRSWQYYC